MKGRLEVLKPGLMTSIQDLGRLGLSYYAIPNSGAMDPNSAKIALLLLDKDEKGPVLECTALAPEIKFHSATEIAISGADFGWQVNDAKINVPSRIKVAKGDVLKGSFAKAGLRGYIALAGNLVLEEVLASYSTYTKAGMGGFHGRNLQKGDILSWTEDPRFIESENRFAIHKGPEFQWMIEESKEILVKTKYRIASDTDRMGMRLEGRQLLSSSHQLTSSSPVLPGFIQLPPSGLPIIVLQDSQTTGGYPRIAYLRELDLGRLNQVPIGHEISFLLP